MYFKNDTGKTQTFDAKTRKPADSLRVHKTTGTETRLKPAQQHAFAGFVFWLLLKECSSQGEHTSQLFTHTCPVSRSNVVMDTGHAIHYLRLLNSVTLCSTVLTKIVQ